MNRKDNLFASDGELMKVEPAENHVIIRSGEIGFRRSGFGFPSWKKSTLIHHLIEIRDGFLDKVKETSNGMKRKSFSLRERFIVGPFAGFAFSKDYNFLVQLPTRGFSLYRRRYTEKDFLELGFGDKETAISWVEALGQGGAIVDEKILPNPFHQMSFKEYSKSSGEMRMAPSPSQKDDIIKSGEIGFQKVHLRSEIHHLRLVEIRDGSLEVLKETSKGTKRKSFPLIDRFVVGPFLGFGFSKEYDYLVQVAEREFFFSETRFYLELGFHDKETAISWVEALGQGGAVIGETMPAPFSAIGICDSLTMLNTLYSLSSLIAYGVTTSPEKKKTCSGCGAKRIGDDWKYCPHCGEPFVVIGEEKKNGNSSLQLLLDE